MPDLASLTDATIPQQDTGLPVEQPYRGPNLGPIQGATDGTIGNTDVVVPAAAPPAVIQALPRPEPMPVIPADPQDFSPDTTVVGSKLDKIINRLTGANGEQRYQLWPEKVVREGLSAAHDAMTEGLTLPGLRREDYTDIPAPDMPTNDSTWLGRALNVAPVAASPADTAIGQAQSIAALAGTGGLAGASDVAAGDAALGSTPFLRPALKFDDKIYKAPVGGQHLDALPAHLAQDFQTKALSGADINDYQFGFMNHKGQFLDREKALDYAVKEGLVDPSAGRYGALTSTLLADSSKPGTAIEAMAKTGSPFYSALEHNVNQISQSKMTGDQWLGTLANKPGVKPEELQWTGLQDFLKENGNQPVTKAQVQEHLANNKVELKEKISHTPNPRINEIIDLDTQARKLEAAGDNEGAAKIREQIKAIPSTGNFNPRYKGYQLPGGENYREMLMTLPGKKVEPPGNFSTYAKSQGYTDEQIKAGFNNFKDPIFSKWDDLQSAYEKSHSTAYKSSHWDEPNILAHVRMNDRTIDGKKSLHLEEIQSDWGQGGRENGFKSDAVNASNKVKALLKEASTLSTKDERYKEIYRELPALQAKASAPVVPDMPFKKTWHELAIKRMLREASEKGYERLSWTSGEHHPTNPKNLRQTGPEADKADKGMRGFYNDILPKAVEKIGKEYGVKVKTHELETNPKGWHITPPTETVSGKWMVKSNDYNSKGFHFDTKEEAEANLAQNIAGERATKKIHYIDIPPKLKDVALNKGFPLFANGYIYTPVSHDPFNKKKK